MTNDEDLLYIEDANNRKLFYRFTPAPFFCPKSRDDKDHTLKKILDMFERVTS